MTTRPVATDPRVFLFMLLGGTIAGMFSGSETALMGLFIVAIIFQVIGGNSDKIPSYVLFWLILWGISRGALVWLNINPATTAAITLSNFGVSGHRAMVPLLFAMLLYRVPVGSFMASLNAMHLPKAVSIGIGIALRFFPTLVQEYRSIRNAQRFRGIGNGFWNTFIHLPQTLSCILLPLVIRITRISEELSASVTVRGVRFHNEVVSFRPVHFTLRDAILLGAGIAAYATILLFDGFGMGRLL